MEACLAEILPAGHVLDEPEHHTNARGGEADVPVHALPEISADERRDERAGVDAHVEDRIARIASAVVRVIQPSNDDADVPFEETRTDDDQRETEVKRRERGNGHAEVA